MASLRSPTYSAQATLLRHAINHSITCSNPSPFRCSDYMTTPIIYCYIFRPPGKWFWTILHATSSLFARWTPLVERKPDSKESGICSDTQALPPSTNRPPPSQHQYASSGHAAHQRVHSHSHSQGTPASSRLHYVGLTIGCKCKRKEHKGCPTSSSRSTTTARNAPPICSRGQPPPSAC